MDIDWGNIVSGVAKNDESSLNQFVELSQTPLLRFCMYLTGDRQLAEDICHDTLIKAIGSIKQLKNPAQVMAWMKRIARNLFLDYCKSAAQSKVHLDINEMVQSPELSMSADATDDQILAMQALQSLSEEDRTIVILIDIEGYSYVEAAQVLEIKEGTVKSKLFRARKKMLEFLETFRGSQSSKNRKA